jgi:hypothetical protein
MTKTIILKIEIENPEALNDALATLVETHGASFYTLVVDGVPQRMGDRHLDVEEREGRAIASALRRVHAPATFDPVLDDVLGDHANFEHPIL